MRQMLAILRILFKARQQHTQGLSRDSYTLKASSSRFADNNVLDAEFTLNVSTMQRGYVIHVRCYA